MRAEAKPRRLAVVAVTYNSGDVLPGFLDSLATGLEGLESCEIVIADNASSDGSADLARAHPIRPNVVQTGRNGGYAAGINAAIATIADDRDILILNPDIRLLPGAVSRLLDALKDSSVGVAVPKILDEDGGVSLSVRREPSLVTIWSDAILGTRIASSLGLGELVATPSLYRDGGSVDWATGAALLVSAHARSVVGAWDESFFLYSEEVDYLRRMRDHGYEVRFVPDARFVHIGGAYHGNVWLSALMTKNRIRYYRRHHGPVSTEIYRVGLLVEGALRYLLGPGHRAAFKASLTTVATSSERPRELSAARASASKAQIRDAAISS